LNGLGALLEILSEPMYILVQSLLLYRVRVKVELCAMVFRCIATYYWVVSCGYGLVGFGFAQILYGALLVVLYYGYFVYYVIFARPGRPRGADDIPVKTIGQLFPHFGSAQFSFLDKSLVWLLLTYSWQSVQKLLLSEGEKLVLMFYQSLFNQGTYSVVTNFGSLVARFLFQPVEEICFSMFSKLLGRVTQEHSQKDVSDAADILWLLTRLMMFIGLSFVTFGPNYSDLLLYLLYGTKFAGTDTNTVLAWYCLYVGVMGINGITEAFVHAVATQPQLAKINWVLFVFAVLYLVVAKILIAAMGTPGLILANCFNMGLRIFYNWRFISNFLKQRGEEGGVQKFRVNQLVPPSLVSGWCILSGVVGYLSWQRFDRGMPGLLGKAIHAGVGSILGVVFLALIYLLDRRFCNDLRVLVKKRKGD